MANERRTRIALLLSSRPNPRIIKRITLYTQFSEVIVIFWNRSGKPGVYNNENCIIKEICIRARDEAIKRLPHYHKFKSLALTYLKEFQPDVLHVQGMDMLNIATQFKHCNKTKLIYEVADLPRLIVDKPKNLIRWSLKYILGKKEEECLKAVELLIVTSEKYYDTRYKEYIPHNKMLYFANVPEMDILDGYKKRIHRDTFTVGFIGAVRYIEQMMIFLDAAEKLNGIHFLIAGYEIGSGIIQERAKQLPNVEWYGEYNFKTEGKTLYERCDAIYSVYDADMENVKVALPNKLYESIFCELPIIVAKNTFLSDIVLSKGVGIAVNHHNSDELTEGIRQLAYNKHFYDRIVNNCHNNRQMVNIEHYNSILREKVETLIAEN